MTRVKSSRSPSRTVIAQRLRFCLFLTLSAISLKSFLAENRRLSFLISNGADNFCSSLILLSRAFATSIGLFGNRKNKRTSFCRSFRKIFLFLLTLTSFRRSHAFCGLGSPFERRLHELLATQLVCSNTLNCSAVPHFCHFLPGSRGLGVRRVVRLQDAMARTQFAANQSLKRW